MKKLMTALFALLTVGVMAQEEPEMVTATTPDEDEPKTLFNQGMAIGGYAGITTKFGQLNGNYGLWSGGQAMLLMGHSIGVGVAGYGLVSPVESNRLASDGNPYYYQMGYGGLMIEPVILPKELVHVTAPILIGAGGVAESLHHPWDNGGYYWDEIDQSESSTFLMIEPGVNAELNICKVVRLDVGASYRFVTESDLISTSDSQLSGFSGNITLKLGWF